MSKRANPTLVGLFVVIGIVITVVTVLLLGSGKLFTTKMPFVLYFKESVNGLSKGAPVKFKGVTIGAVDQILLHYDNTSEEIHIPVIIHLNANQILDNLALPLHASQEAVYVDLVNHLIGKLETDSFVTGRLYIGLHYDAAADAKRTPHQGTLPHPEIPTEPSSFKAFTDQLSNIDIAGISERAKVLLDQLNKNLAEIAFDEINAEVLATIKSVRAKIETADIDASLAAFNKAMAAAEGTLKSLEKTSDQIRTLSATAQDEVKPLMAGINQTTARAVDALKTIEATAGELRSLVNAQSPAYLKVMKTLDELNLLTRSIRELADKINRDPKMFLTGKPKPE
jgi:paraquat-inducible protein B